MVNTAQPVEGEHAAAEHGGREVFNAGEVIIEHVSNSSIEHPILHLPKIAGIDFSVTKHVMMMWLVAGFLFFTITLATRRYLAQERKIPTGFMNALEWLVQFIRDSIVLPNVGVKFVNTWAPLILTLFVFILASNAVGLIPIFEIFGLIDRFILLNSPESESLINSVLHGGTTTTANYNVTAALATITFFAIILAGTLAHGFVSHWRNLVPSGLAWPIYILLIPIEIISYLSRPISLSVRLFANMLAGHTLLKVFAGFVISLGIVAGWLPLAFIVALTGLEIVIAFLQAFVFAILTCLYLNDALYLH